MHVKTAGAVEGAVPTIWPKPPEGAAFRLSGRLSLGVSTQLVWSSVVAPAEFFFTDSMPFRVLAFVS